MKLKITLILLLQAFCFQQIYAQCDGADFQEQNGIAILELDSKVSGSWKKESTSGSSGGSALTYGATRLALLQATQQVQSIMTLG